MIISVGVSMGPLHSITFHHILHSHAFHFVTFHSFTQYRYGVEWDGLEFSHSKTNYTKFTFVLLNYNVHCDQSLDFLQIELGEAKIGNQLYNLPDERSGVV